MKVLLTGGNGFIGSYVKSELTDRGHDVVVFDRKNCPDFLGDIRDWTSVSEAFANVDAFIHLAGVLGTQETVKDPRPAVDTNINGTLNVLEASVKYDVPGCYITLGNHFMDNTYSITKSTMERFVRMYNKERGGLVNVVRAMNAYGPGQSVAPPFGPARVRKITPSFCCRALSNMDLEVYGDGSQISDMVYVGDVAKALVIACEKARKGDVFDTVEIGPEENLTVREIAELIIGLSGSRSKITNLPMRPGEVKGNVKADTLTLSKLGMSAKDLTSIEDGLMETIDYYRQYLMEIAA